jgi:adenylylsulfate kinase
MKIITKSENLIKQSFDVTTEMRGGLLGHQSCCLWFTGLSGSGKSTLANLVETKLFDLGFHTFVLDGDNMRHGLNKDLGFSDQDRIENIRRVAEVSKLFVDAGIIVLSSFISPFIKDREFARSLVSDQKFYEIYCECPIEICEKRDVKGLYKKARNNEILNFTGISSPYEKPVNADLVINTAQIGVDDAVAKIVDMLLQKKIINKSDWAQFDSSNC